MSTPTVTVDLDGRSAAWSAQDGFTGDHDIVAAAELAVAIYMSVDVGESLVAADAHTPLGATGALLSHRPGRTRVITCPQEVIDALDGRGEDDEEDLID